MAEPPAIVLPIVEAVAREFQITAAELLGPRTCARAALPRAVAMVLTGALCRWDDIAIARAFNRNRRTVFSARCVVNARRDHDADFALRLASLEVRLLPQIEARRQVESLVNEAVAQVTRSLINQVLEDPEAAAASASRLMEIYA